jgi:RNA recognition motif-containing protein
MQSLTEGFHALAVEQVSYQTGYYAPPVDNPLAHQQYATSPNYIRNPNGLSVNASNGLVPTESREVHISNIQYQVRKKDLTAYIKKIVDSFKLELHVDHTGKFKGTAVVTFESGADANLVVAQLDRMLIKGKKIKVRLGKQQTPVNPSPLVVDGSGRVKSTGY